MSDLYWKSFSVATTIQSGIVMQISRCCAAAIVLIAALVIILQPAIAISSLSVSEIFAPACTTGDALKDVTVSSAVVAFSAGFLAGLNPCLLAMLAFLASSMLTGAGRRRDILIMVAFFSLGTFAVNIIFGMGIFSILQEKSATDMIRFVLTAILLALGLMQLEDARRLHCGGASIFRTDWTKKYVSSVTASRRLSYYFLLGGLFSLVRAPCVGGIYIAIIGMISARGYASSGPVYLMIYNLGIALPMLVIGWIIALGMRPEQVDEFRQKHRVAIRLITGLTLLAMASLIYWQMI